MSRGFLQASLRPGHPDFLDLPWEWPLEAWEGRCARLETLPRGEARHAVVFVNYTGVVYALKALPPGRAEEEYALLREMEERRLPAVRAIGHLGAESEAGEISVLVTRYLDHSLPYHSLFVQPDLHRYRDHLLDALAGLLVQLHLAHVYWGDCSLSNTLFLRDAGQLQAVLVDAETSEAHQALSDVRRQDDLAVMEENVGGALLDLISLGALPRSFPYRETATDIRRRYDDLWREISREELLRPSDRFLIEDRVRKLNALGFSVGEIALAPSGDQLKLKVFVTDRSFHRELLCSLTGLDAQERQAQQLVNEIQQVRAALAEQQQRSLSLSGAAYHWLEKVFRPTVRRLVSELDEDGGDPVERYFELLEHKWYLSERAQRDVGLEAAVADYLAAVRLGRSADDTPQGSNPPDAPAKGFA